MSRATQQTPDPAEREMDEIILAKPVRDALESLEELEKDQTDLYGAESAVARVIGRIRKRLAESIEAAEDPGATVYLETYAEYKRITIDAAYKRYQHGKIPGARKDTSRRIVVPLASLAA